MQTDESTKLKQPPFGQKSNLSADPQKAKEFKRQMEQQYRAAALASYHRTGHTKS